MKLLMTILVLGLVLSSDSNLKDKSDEYGLPVLHQISQQTLSPTYSCRPAEEFQKGYENTALFLSEHSRKRNSPDLLFEGACRSDDVFKVSTTGDDMALIADLGTDVNIEDVSAHAAFNLENIARPESYSRFTREVGVKANHTYAVSLNKSEIRGLFVFKVTEHEKNAKVSIKYAVKSYQVIKRVDESEGFDWQKKNSDS